MWIDAIHQPVQIAELRGQPRIEFEHGHPTAVRFVHEFHVEQAARESGGRQEASRDVQCRLLHRGRQHAGIVPALKSLRAGIAVRIHDAEQMYPALVHPAVEIVLTPRERLFHQQAQHAACLREAFGNDTLERSQHASQRPARERTEAGQPLERRAVLDATGEYGERAPQRLHMTGIGQDIGHVRGVQGIDRAETHVRFRTHLLQHLPHVALVLAGDDRFRRGAGQAAALGHQRSGERALKFVMRQHRVPALAARDRGLRVGIAFEVEGGDPELAEQSAGTEAAAVEAQIAPLQAGMREGVVILVEQQSDTTECRRSDPVQASRPVRSGS